MRVRDLINELQKCDPTSHVMYNMKTGLQNDELRLTDCNGNPVDACHFGVHDVQIGYGTLRRFVFLTEEPIEEMNDE